METGVNLSFPRGQTIQEFIKLSLFCLNRFQRGIGAGFPCVQVVYPGSQLLHIRAESIILSQSLFDGSKFLSDAVIESGKFCIIFLDLARNSAEAVTYVMSQYSTPSTDADIIRLAWIVYRSRGSRTAACGVVCVATSEAPYIQRCGLCLSSVVGASTEPMIGVATFKTHALRAAFRSSVARI